MADTSPKKEHAATQVNPNISTKRRRDINWAAALATVIGLPLALAAIALGFFQKEVRTALNLDATSIPSATPLMIAPAKPGESLILVADFEPRPRDANLKDDPAQYIFEELKEQIRRDNLNIRVERLRQVVDDNTARPTGAVYSATILLWGWYGDRTISPRIERFGLKTTYVSDQEDKRFSLSNPERIDAILLNDLPSQAKYVIFFTLSLEQADLDAALRYANSALAGVQPGADLKVNDAYFQQGWIYQTQGKIDLAIMSYDEAIKLKPDDAAAFNNRGVAYRAKGELDNAIADYGEAIRLKPDDAAAFNNRGVAYRAKGELDKAIADCGEAIRLKPESADAFNNRGNAYRDKGEMDRAIADYNEAIRLKPESADAFNNRGLTYGFKGELDKAITDFDQAIRLKPDDAKAFLGRGAMYLLKTNKKKALADLQQALTLTSNPSQRAQIESLIKQAQ